MTNLKIKVKTTHGLKVPQDPKAIDLLVKMYWLMKDVAEKQAYKKVKFNIYDVVKYEGQPNQHWCGTSACVIGFAAIAGIFDNVKVLRDKETRHISISVYTDTVNYNSPLFVLDQHEKYNIPVDIWSMFVHDMYYGEYYSNGKLVPLTYFDCAIQAKHAIIRLQEILKIFYSVDVETYPEPTRPWLGKEKAFEKII